MSFPFKILEFLLYCVTLAHLMLIFDDYISYRHLSMIDCFWFSVRKGRGGIIVFFFLIALEWYHGLISFVPLISACHFTVTQRFLTRGSFAPQGTLGNVWRHF